MRSSRVGVCLLVVLGFAFVGFGDGMRVGGGWRETSVKGPRGEVEELARFAVDEHNKNENSLLEFVRVVKAKEQVVAGILHQLTLEAMDGGKKKFYEVKVWVKPWMNFKQLQEFKLCDHETKTGGNVIS